MPRLFRAIYWRRRGRCTIMNVIMCISALAVIAFAAAAPTVSDIIPEDLELVSMSKPSPSPPTSERGEKPMGPSNGHEIPHGSHIATMGCKTEACCGLKAQIHAGCDPNSRDQTGCDIEHAKLFNSQCIEAVNCVQKVCDKKLCSSGRDMGIKDLNQFGQPNFLLHNPNGCHNYLCCPKEAQGNADLKAACHRRVECEYDGCCPGILEFDKRPAYDRSIGPAGCPAAGCK